MNGVPVASGGLEITAILKNVRRLVYLKCLHGMLLYFILWIKIQEIYEIVEKSSDVMDGINLAVEKYRKAILAKYAMVRESSGQIQCVVIDSY